PCRRRRPPCPGSGGDPRRGGPDGRRRSSRLLPSFALLGAGATEGRPISSAGDGVDDVRIAGAAAEVALDAVADLLPGGLGVPFQQLDARQDQPRGAVAALEAV